MSIGFMRFGVGCICNLIATFAYFPFCSCHPICWAAPHDAQGCFGGDCDWNLGLSTIALGRLRLAVPPQAINSILLSPSTKRRILMFN